MQVKKKSYGLNKKSFQVRREERKDWKVSYLLFKMLWFCDHALSLTTSELEGLDEPAGRTDRAQGRGQSRENSVADMEV